MATYTQTATIPKTAERCKAENLGITAWNLREWCKSGALKHIRCGTKFLIYWPNLLEFLETGMPVPTAEPTNAAAPYGTMRRIEEKL